MNADEAPLSRRAAVLLCALLVGHGLLAYQARARGVFTFGDDAAYLLLSRSLRAFSYRELQFVGEPIAARFPPGYPGLLALLSIAGEHFRLISLAGIALSVSGLYALFDVIRRRWSADVGLLVTAVAATNPTMVANAGAIASESMFTALAFWTLWAADRTDHGQPRGITAGLSAILAAMTRSAGVTLPLALGAHWLLRRRYRRLAILALASAVTVGAWLAWTTVAPRREFRRSYIDDAVTVRSGNGSLVSTLASRMKVNVYTYVGQTMPSELMLPVTKRTQLDNVGWVALIGALALAGMLSAWTRWNAAVIWFLGYSALLAVWAFVIPRFLQPLIPLLIAFMIVGAWTIGQRWRPPGSPSAALPAVMLSAMLAYFGLLGSATVAAQQAACDLGRSECAESPSLDFLDALHYVATHTDSSARLVTPKSPTLYYYAPPRQSVYWDEIISQDSASFIPFLDHNRVTHVLLTPVFSDQITVARLAATHCTQFDLMKAFAPETMVLERRESPSGTDTPACRATVRAVERAEKRERSQDHGEPVFRVR